MLRSARSRARVSPLLTELRRGPAFKVFCAVVAVQVVLKATRTLFDQSSLPTLLLAMSAFAVSAGWHGARERRCRTRWLGQVAVRSALHRFLLAAVPAVFWPLAAALPLLQPDFRNADLLYFDAAVAQATAIGTLAAFALGRLVPFRLLAPVLAVGAYYLLALLYVGSLTADPGSTPEPKPAATEADQPAPAPGPEETP
ncbi:MULTISPECIES: hypothetical protein [unclassified Streptomyces]|uniref:hypothetical protein n=1 Tax=unclassified Streptomyces TaxID=2593676 RepID=UPI002DD9AD00|nr:hypothetical protein [Streptomyces sp. NBC_00243]WRZ19801.1 hypothetical protein OHT59_15535 [Streptomyces sp. NBC_00243]